MKRIGPEQTGSTKFDNLDVCLIPFVYLFQIALTLLSVSIIIMPYSCRLVRALRYGCMWIAGSIKNVFLCIFIFDIHPLLILL